MTRRIGDKMGELIDFAVWKKRKEDEEHEKEMEEIRALQAEVTACLDSMEDLSTGPFVLEEDREAFAARALQIMITALDGYTHWPIDSTDL